MVIYPNPSVESHFADGITSREAIHFHRLFDNYAQSQLTSAPALAALLGVKQLLIKDESSRMGLPAYKFLGASWAIFNVLRQRLARPNWLPNSLAEMRAAAETQPPVTLMAATEGNHGRAVARMARLLGWQANIFVGAHMIEPKREQIRSEGAALTVVDGTYDDAVRLSAESASDTHLILSDTAWEGYTQIPSWVIEGYATIFAEVDAQCAAQGWPRPTVAAAQIGVGALASAVVSYTKANGGRVVGVEPAVANCAMAAVQAGKLVEIPGPHTSSMSGMNCGLASLVALPWMTRGIDLFAAIEDDHTYDAMRLLASVGVVAGECGAAGLAGLMAIKAQMPDAFSADDTALVIITEGANNPENYRRVIETRF